MDIQKIHKQKKNIDIEKLETNELISTDDKTGYYTGQLCRYLINHSNAKNKQKLIRPLSQSQSIQEFKRTFVREYLDKYTYNLNMSKGRSELTSAIIGNLDSISSNFDNFKVAFYTGFFDDNIFYTKSNKEEQNE